MGAYFQPLLQFLAWVLNRSLAEQLRYLKEENAILRSKLPKRLTISPEERRALLRFGEPLGKAIKDLITIVTPRTFARWLQEERQAQRKRVPRGPGRKPTPADIEELVLRMARENSWGYTRILGELRKLGIRKICRTTALNILRAHRFDPGPRRGSGSWDEFVKRHAQTLWACDFFSVKTWTLTGVVEMYVLFFIHVGSRRAHIAGMTANPDADWVAQQARNLCMFFDTQEHKPTHLLRDRDTKFTAQFDAILASDGVEVKPVSARAPNMNAAAEKFVQSTKAECTDHFVFLGERHLRHALREWERFYNEQRTHQGVGNRPLGDWPVPDEPAAVHDEDVVCDERLGGLLRSYRLAAAA